MGNSSPHRDSPGEIDRLVVLAEQHQAARRFAEAEQAYRGIIALRPDLAEAYLNLGNALLGQGRLAEAAAEYEQALRCNAGLFQAHNNLAGVLARQGQLERAAASYERALALEPGLPELHAALAGVLARQGQHERAAAHFQQALAIRPDFPQVHFHYGNLLRTEGKLAQAVAHYRQAVALRPELVEAHHKLGSTLASLGQLDEAIAQFQTVTRLDPNSPQVLTRLGGLLREQGRFDEALAHYNRALTLDPNCADAHLGRANIKTFRPGDLDLAALQAIAADSARLPEQQRASIHFALGKALEDVGDPDGAMRQWIAANALKRRHVDYDEAAHLENLRLLRDFFAADRLARGRGTGDPSPTPIFILGMPRSGSSLVEQILASHPAIHGGGELGTLDELVHERQAIGGLAALEAEGWRRLGEQYLAGLPPLPAGKTRITDKMPGNFMYVGLIHLILPHAKIIHTLRDPVDTCLSCFSRLLTTGNHFYYDLAELGRYYRHYRELMDHWRSVLPAGAMLDVAYEDVVDDLEGQARRLIDYLGLPWDERCLSFHKTVRPVATASSVQVRQPLFRSGVARWRQYKKYLDPLLAELAGLLPSP